MFLRQLTDQEIERIKKAKDVIKDQRQSLQQDIKRQRQRIREETKRLKGRSSNPDMFKTLNGLRGRLSELQNQLSTLPIITGLPVIVKVEDRSLRMNYEILKKFDRSLDRSNLRCTDIKIDDKSLIIHYEKHGQKGAVEINELPPHQLDLLNGLPTIDLKE